MNNRKTLFIMCIMLHVSVFWSTITILIMLSLATCFNDHTLIENKLTHFIIQSLQRTDKQLHRRFHIPPLYLPCPLLNSLLSLSFVLRFLSFYVFSFCDECSSLGRGPVRFVRWSQSCPVEMCLNVACCRQCLSQWWMDCWNAVEVEPEHRFVVSIERQRSTAEKRD